MHKHRHHTKPHNAIEPHVHKGSNSNHAITIICDNQPPPLPAKHASKCRLTDRQCLEIPFGKRVSICGALNTGGHYRYCPPKILSRISYACVRFLAERANYPVNPDPQSFYGSSIRRRWDCACTASFPISVLFYWRIVIFF